jgi:ABC-2 type transport system ATP-binding protein
MIEAHGLTKRYGTKLAVDDLSFTVRPGAVTGFLGPNGAGKSTTIRMILGLDAPTAGSVTVNGRPYAEHAAPLREAGALLEARAVHTGRSARDHLLALAATTGISRRRVDEVIGLVGLGDVARKRAGGFSLGMGQRLGIAAALLGDPATLILDEPVNGLDPEGILWIRNLPQAARLRDALAGPRVTITTAGTDGLDIEGVDSEAIGDIACGHGIPLHELIPHTASLEEAFMELTRDDVEYRAGPTAGAVRSA